MEIVIYNKRIQRNIPRTAILIDRTTKWGNPFVISSYLTREQCILKYEHWLFHTPAGYRRLTELSELFDKSLICWCYPELCHGTILAREASFYKLLGRPRDCILLQGHKEECVLV